MGEVIEFVTETRSRRMDPESGNVRRAGALQVALRKKAKLSRGDQERAPRNLHLLLEELQLSRGLKKVQVARAARLGGTGTDSTKQLDTYTLPSDLEKTSMDSRLTRLAKKPTRYFDIARAIAEVLDEAIEPYLCRIFEGCSFGTGAEFENDWEEQSWITLARQLAKMSESVIAELDLNQFWRDIVAVEGIYDVRSGGFEKSCNALWPFIENYALSGAFLCSDEIPPIPSVLLARRQQGAYHDGLLRLQDGQQLPLTLGSWLEIRLAVGPRNSKARVQGLLEFRTVLEGVDGDGRFVSFDNPHTDGSDFVSTAVIDGQDREISSFLYDPETSPLPEFREFCEHSYFSWQEISPGLLQKLFAAPGKAFNMPNRLSGACLGNTPSSRFPTGSPAAIIQTELLFGATETDLKEASKGLVRDFYKFRTEMREGMEVAEAQAEARWTESIQKGKDK